MGALNTVTAHPVILFDGVCNLCNSSVQFIIRHDRSGYFKFASLQSSFGQDQLRRYNLPVDQLHSVIIIKDGRIFQRSDAALEIVKGLGGLWPALFVFKILPRFFRDGLYNFIAANRYAWFGRKDACMIPTPELKSRFME